MSIQMPETPDEMMRLPGVTKANFEKYGQKLLAITVSCSAEKFCILSEHDDKIEEFETQSRPSTSTAKGRGKNDSTWIDMDSQASTSSSYFPKKTATKKKTVKRKTKRASPKKRRSPAKRKTVTSSVLSKARKSFSRAPSSTPFKYSPTRKVGTSTATAAKKKPTTTASSSSSMGGGLKLMPMPKPVKRNLNL